VLAEGALARLLRSDAKVRLFGRILLIAGVGYLAYTVVAGAGQLAALDWRRYAQASLVGLALYPVSLFAQAIAWALAFGLLGRSEPGIDWRDVEIFASSHLMRRLPGGVWYLVSRVGAYRDQGVDARAPLLASLGELLLLTGVAMLAYLTLSFVPTAEAPKVIAALAAAGLVSWLAGEALTRAPWSAPPSQAMRRRAGPTYLLVGGLHAVALATGGAILWAFLQAAGATEVGLVQATATWALVAGASTLLGLIPGGVGLRDVTLAVVLVGYVGPAAAIIALLFRLLFVVGDLLWGTALLLLTGWARRRYRADRADAVGAAAPDGDAASETAARRGDDDHRPSAEPVR
jgi:hypothetical protein